MSEMKLTLHPVDFKTPFSLGDCIMSIALLSIKHGLKYEPGTSGAVLSGNRKDLTGFLESLKHAASDGLGKGFVIISSIDGTQETVTAVTEETSAHKKSGNADREQARDIILGMIG